MAAQFSADGEKIAMLAIFDTANPAHYRDLPKRRPAEDAGRPPRAGRGQIRALACDAKLDRIGFPRPGFLRELCAQIELEMAQDFAVDSAIPPAPRDLKDFLSRVHGDCTAVFAASTRGQRRAVLLLSSAAGSTEAIARSDGISSSETASMFCTFREITRA